MHPRARGRAPGAGRARGPRLRSSRRRRPACGRRAASAVPRRRARSRARPPASNATVHACRHSGHESESRDVGEADRPPPSRSASAAVTSARTAPRVRSTRQRSSRSERRRVEIAGRRGLAEVSTGREPARSVRPETTRSTAAVLGAPLLVGLSSRARTRRGRHSGGTRRPRRARCRKGAHAARVSGASRSPTTSSAGSRPGSASRSRLSARSTGPSGADRSQAPRQLGGGRRRHTGSGGS